MMHFPRESESYLPETGDGWISEIYDTRIGPGDITPGYVAAWVARINSARNDPYTAHEIEDVLWSIVLEAIQHGAADPAELARQALLTRKIKFTHHYS
jgi:hypothetical protein